MADTFIAFCPRCDESRGAETFEAAKRKIRDHISIQIDELHDGALEAWDDDGV